MSEHSDPFIIIPTKDCFKADIDDFSIDYNDFEDSGTTGAYNIRDFDNVNHVDNDLDGCEGSEVKHSKIVNRVKSRPRGKVLVPVSSI